MGLADFRVHRAGVDRAHNGRGGWRSGRCLDQLRARLVSRAGRDHWVAAAGVMRSDIMSIIICIMAMCSVII